MRQYLEELAKYATDQQPDQPVGTLPTLLRQLATYRHLQRIGQGAAITVGAAAALGAFMPGVRREVSYGIQRLLRRVPRDPGFGEAVPAHAQETARLVLKRLRDAGVDPAQARIGVAGIGGSGKSTVARALAHAIGTHAHELDVTEKTMLNGRRLEAYIRQQPPAPGSVYEQTHLFNKVDPQLFDVALRVTTPVEQSRAQLLNRGRGAWQYDLYNTAKLNKTVHTGYEQLGGKVLGNVGNVEIRVAPKGGFDRRVLEKALMSAQMDPHGLTREEQVQSMAAGHRVQGATGLRYFRGKRLAGLLGAPVAVGAGTAYALHKRDERKDALLNGGQPFRDASRWSRWSR